jgi:multidrug efflux system membrane fusion protein
MRTDGPALALLAVAVLMGCSREEPPRPAATVPVVVGTAVRRPMPVRVTAIGNVRPDESVTVRSEVMGPLATVHFEEGSDVRRGQLLFTIDPRPFEAHLRRAQAQLARDTATAAHARREAARYAELFTHGLVSRSQYEEMTANAAAAEATVRADRATVEDARLMLERTKIRSPIAGKTGRVLVTRGNLVEANATELVVVNRLRPIEVGFAVPAEHLAEIRRRMGQAPLAVAATPSGAAEPVVGRLTFVDNRVDPQTGTIQLQATFANEDARLWPGQFVDVVLTLSVEQDALVVPAAAVQSGQQGAYVFVVGTDGTVESRPVAVARQVGDDIVLTSGVAEGETVVTEGQLRLVPGARVEIQAAPSASPPTSAPDRPRP